VTYGVAATVKDILVIASAETTFDAEIAACITSSDALVEGMLARQGLTVPSSTPQNIIDASNYFAAWMFRKRRDVPSSWIFFVDAEKFLNAYCDSQQAAADLPIAISQDTS
jgi:hypothetical protein